MCHSLYIQFLDLPRMFSEEDTPGFGVLVLHQFRHQSRRQHTVFHCDAPECAPCGIKHSVAQFFGIHLTQAFETLELEALGSCMCLNKLVACLIIQQPCYFSLVLDRIQWWAGNKDMASLDQIAKFLVK